MLIAVYVTSIVVGLYLVVAALRNSDWIRAFSEIELVEAVLGETASRIACPGVGILCIVVVVLFWTNVI